MAILDPSDNSSSSGGTQGEQAETDAPAKLPFATFLETIGPLVECKIGEALGGQEYTSGKQLVTPNLQLHCDHQDCGGPRLFEYKGGAIYLPSGQYSNLYLLYICANCKKTARTFAVRILRQSSKLEAMKYGEIPAFGPPVPRVSSRLSDQIETSSCRDAAPRTRAWASARSRITGESLRIKKAG